MNSEVTLRISACRADSTSSREGPPDMSTAGRECRAEEDWREGSCIGAEERIEASHLSTPRPFLRSNRLNVHLCTWSPRRQGT